MKDFTAYNAAQKEINYRSDWVARMTEGQKDTGFSGAAMAARQEAIVEEQRIIAKLEKEMQEFENREVA